MWPSGGGIELQAGLGEDVEQPQLQRRAQCVGDPAPARRPSPPSAAAAARSVWIAVMWCANPCRHYDIK